MPSVGIRKSADRAFFDHGWLKTHHSFSFAEYHDPQNLSWGALRVLNDDTVAPGRGFGTHPHQDMEILTYVLDGALEHRDTLGNHGIVMPGGVQYVSAGSGLAHSEFNHSPDADVRFVQMWVTPNQRGYPPRYGQVDISVLERSDRWLVIASGHKKALAPIDLRQDATCSVARLEEATLPLDLERDRRGFLFVASGHVRALERTGARYDLSQGDAMTLLGPAEIDISGNAEVIYWDTIG